MASKKGNVAAARLSVSAALLFCLTAAGQAQSMTKTKAVIRHLQRDFAISELDNRAWVRADEIKVTNYWNGREAEPGRQFKVSMIWSRSALYIRFEAIQSEPLVINDRPDLSKKTMNLWDRDVCEVFIAPDRASPNKYYEYEVAPTGEWIDLAIEVLPAKRVTDWKYISGMQTAAEIGSNRVVMAMQIPWKAFGQTPKAGDIWLGNIFRCVGRGPGRGYLAWQPTMTPEPNFHVPEKFGEFIFDK